MLQGVAPVPTKQGCFVNAQAWKPALRKLQKLNGLNELNELNGEMGALPPGPPSGEGELLSAGCGRWSADLSCAWVF